MGINPYEKTINATCPMCHGTGRHQIFDKNWIKTEVTCHYCAARFVVGSKIIEVTGTDSNEVEQVLKTLIDQLSQMIEGENNEETVAVDQELKSILDQIKKGNLNVAIENTMHFCQKNSKKHYEEILGYSSRYAKLSKNNRKGIISNEENQREEARLTNSILELISLIMEDYKK